MTPRVIIGDCLDVLAEMPAGSVQCVVTSPPYYNLRDYSVPPSDWPAIEFAPMPGLPPVTVPAMSACLGLEPDPWAFVGHLVEVFRRVRRVLRDDGVLFLNLGDSYNAAGRVGHGTRIGYKQGTNRASANGHDDNRPSIAGLKPKDLIGIPWRVAFAAQADGWFLRQDIIWAKCLSGGDIEFELRSGERIGCTREHKWPTTRGLLEAADVRVGDVLQWCQLPEPTICRRPSALDDDMVGWFVGLYIAEGSRHDGTIHIASHKRETSRFDRLRALADAFDGHFFLHEGEGNSASAVINGPIINALIDAYISGRTAADKHLSPRCWKRSNAFLRAVLDGYLSGDGHNRDGRWVLGFCKNDALATDLRVLCARIRASLRLRRCKHQMDGRTFPGWRGSLYFDPSRRRRPDTEIVAIRQSRARKFYDIVLESDPHLFALGSGVLTHNSNPMPESVRDRCTKAHEYVFLLAKSERYFWDAAAVAEVSTYPGDNRALRTDTRKEFQIGCIDKGSRSRTGNPTGTTRNRRSVWSIATQPYSGAHYATFPPALVEPCILAGSRVGDTILDPFGGTGTVGSVAAYHDRRAVLIDINPANEALMGERLSKHEAPLFDDLVRPTQGDLL